MQMKFYVVGLLSDCLLKIAFESFSSVFEKQKNDEQVGNTWAEKMVLKQ
jgi:hypothetical protein